ncbi:3D domain-containing protein [Anaeroselena agilis]|uniref:G5 domain-containing protein n=1 Tax=Anaeroselena agilis TaxID=3063788 RepID=A0ABU3P3T9_9FIRM|nr:G5 domain-containing protein [Selenomonadales bacterium 4137-cl]
MSGLKTASLRKFAVNFDRGRTILVAALIITSLVITGAVWSSKNVTVVADGKKTTIYTVHDNPQDILHQIGVYLASKDEYRMSTANVTEGTIITVYRAVPVEVIYKDRTRIVITGKPTAGEVAASLGYGPGRGRTEPAETTPVKPMMKIRLISLTESMVTRKVPIPPPVVRQPDGTLERGLEEVLDEGEEGLKEATVKLHFEDGAQTATTTVTEKMLVEPKPQILRVGTRETVQTSRGTMRFRKAYLMEATAYLPTDGSGEGITASGLAARHGIVAVDPSVIPLGTRVYVPGYGLALAADTGGAIIGHRIDLCIEDYDAAWAFGRQMVKVYVLAD